MLELPGGEVWAIEVKRFTAPKARRGFWNAADDIGATRRVLLYPGSETFPIHRGAEVVPVADFVRTLSGLSD